MLAALLLAMAQPPMLEAVLAPTPGSYGWIEQLAGSCFTSGEDRSRFVTSECFAIRDGQFVLTSFVTNPRHATREECTLRSAREGVLRFDCSYQGRPRQEMVGRYRDGAFVTRRPSRSAAITWRERVETVWRRQGHDQLSVTVEMPVRDERALPLPPPRLLTRAAR